jgi:hypothetical protein
MYLKIEQYSNLKDTRSVAEQSNKIRWRAKEEYQKKINA